VVEPAAYWTTSRTGESTPSWPQTKQGQYDYLLSLANAVKDIPRLQGIFYWGTTWAQEDEWFVEYPSWYADEYPYDAEDRALFDTAPDSNIATLNPGADAFLDAGGLATRGVDISEALIAEQSGVLFLDAD
jgi:arabinogalactan endo-1,4-beta-galactosidase